MPHCLYCFFKNEYQDELKRRAFGKPSFEETLRTYRDIYCDELSDVVPVEECERSKRHLGLCPDSAEYLHKDGMGNWPSEVVDFINEVTENVKSQINDIREYFNSIINIYESQSPDSLTSFIEKNCTSFYAESDIYYTKPWFRARKVGSYDPHDISEMFHIPFTKLELTGNQRFSMPGQPYLYLAESLSTAAEEIGAKENELNAVLFIPDYSKYYHKGTYNIGNSFIKELNAYVHLTEDGSELIYDNNFFTFSKKNMPKILGDTILFQIMQFPTQKGLRKENLIPEYILPQMFMRYEANNGMAGVLYESSKDIKFSDYTRFEELPIENLCIPAVRPKNPSDKYDEGFLNSFFYTTYKAGEPLLDFPIFSEELSECREKNRAQAQTYNMNDYGIYLAKIENHIEIMKKYCGEEYFDTVPGKIEVTLLYQFLKQIRPILEEPCNYGLHKWNREKLR